MLNTHVAIILDRSSSMESIRKETIEAFNTQVKSIRESAKGQETTVSLFTFATTPDEPTIFAKAPEALKELTWSDYVPNGWTALNDTVLETTKRLAALPNSADPETAYLVIIISDGDENRSLHTPEEVKARLEELQATRRWTFTYVGCSQQDLLRMRSLGISAGNSRLFEASSQGVESTSALNCSATANYFSARSMGLTACDSLYDQAEKSLGIVSQPVVNPGVSINPTAWCGTLYSGASVMPALFDCDKLVGLSEVAAEAAVVLAGKYTQVAKRDGVDQILPAILDDNRVRLTIDRGNVTEAQLG